MLYAAATYHFKKSAWLLERQAQALLNAYQMNAFIKRLTNADN